MKYLIGWPFIILWLVACSIFHAVFWVIYHFCYIVWMLKIDKKLPFMDGYVLMWINTDITPWNYPEPNLRQSIWFKSYYHYLWNIGEYRITK